MEHPFDAEYWDRIIYDLNIKPIKYINNALKLDTFEGSDDSQNLFLMVDEYIEPKEEDTEPIIEDIKGELAENITQENIYEDEINNKEIEAPNNPLVTEDVTDESTNNSSSKPSVETQDSKGSEPFNEDIDISDLSSMERIKLQIDNILKKMGNYLTQND